ncbi:hypothetical protein D3X12_19305 [Pseudomonas protegens]|nr:hypothetical protein CEP86_32310 [Pseudomonas protegens]QEZ55148.1 hypothetical protein D3X12_19305 [Pseudomonas protegens]QEZ55256.1 hypothetical protein D4N38_00175 [Pseudomonas protegens]QEZ67279.1 hypothetical protein D4N37_14630 [Pseudomonas protegens]
MPTKRPASPASSSPTPSLASQLLRAGTHIPCRSRLADEDVRQSCTTLESAFAGTPAPAHP